jgi:hypothetical protein
MSQTHIYVSDSWMGGAPPGHSAQAKDPAIFEPFFKY